MAAISFPTAADTPSRTTYTINAPWTDSVNGGEWWFSSTKVRWMPVVAGGGASDFGDLGGVPADNAALADALALKAPLASPTFTGTVTATGTVTVGARVTATRGTVGVGTVYTNFGLTNIAGTSTDFLSRFVVGDLITFNTTVGSQTRVITAIASDTSMTTVAFSGPSASGAEAYTHTAASAVMNPSGAITGRTGTFSGAVSGTNGFFTGTVAANSLALSTPLPIESGGTGVGSIETLGTFRTDLGLGTGNSPTFAGLTVASGPIATSQPLALTQTWITTATYTGLRVNVTDSGPSNSASLLMDLQTGGVSRFRADKSGNVIAGSVTGQLITKGENPWEGVSFRNSGGAEMVRVFSNSSSGGLVFRFETVQNMVFMKANGADATSNGIVWQGATTLTTEGVGNLAQRNGTNAQKFRVYGTTTGSKYVQLEHDGTNAKLSTTSGNIHISNIPTTNPGAGILWNDAGTLKIGT